jgi:hypothetical protein
MKTMGNYCKAYLVKSFREFPRWQEKTEALRPERTTDAGQPRLDDDDCLFLQENLVVTDGIYLDENIVFDEISQEWREFCAQVLKFEVPGANVTLRNTQTASAPSFGQPQN